MVSEPINSSLFHQLAEQLHLEQIQKQLLEHQQKVAAATTSCKRVSSKDSALERVLERHINDGLPVLRLNPTLSPDAEETAKNSLTAKCHSFVCENLLTFSSFYLQTDNYCCTVLDLSIGLYCSCFFLFFRQLKLKARTPFSGQRTLLQTVKTAVSCSFLSQRVSWTTP